MEQRKFRKRTYMFEEVRNCTNNVVQVKTLNATKKAIENAPKNGPNLNFHIKIFLPYLLN